MSIRKKYKCRNCNSRNILNLINFNKLPLANNLLLTPKSKVKRFELKLVLCKKCWLVQTTKNINKDEIFNSDYPYLTSTSTTANNNAYDLYKFIYKNFELKGKTLIELASNDGYFLKNFKKHKKIDVLGIEPTPIPAKISKNRGIKTIKDFFGLTLAKKLKKKYKSVDLIVANNVIAHLSNIHDFVKGMKILLSDNGTIILEFQYFIELVKKNLIDNIYHEHYFYYSLTSIRNLLERHNLRIYDVQKINVHGGSLRVFVCHSNNKKIPTTSYLKKMMINDYKLTKNLNFYKSFQSNYNILKKNLKNFFLKHQDKKIIGFGAAAKASTFINIFDLNNYNINLVIDNAKTKQGKFISGTNIKVTDPKSIKIKNYDYVLIFAWNLKKEIIKFIKKFYNKPKIKCVTFVPKIRIDKI